MKVENGTLRVYLQDDGRYVCFGHVKRQRDAHTEQVEERRVESAPHAEVGDAVADAITQLDLLR